MMMGYTGAAVSHAYGTPFGILHVDEMDNMSYSLIPVQGPCPSQVWMVSGAFSALSSFSLRSALTLSCRGWCRLGQSCASDLDAQCQLFLLKGV